MVLKERLGPSLQSPGTSSIDPDRNPRSDPNGSSNVGIQLRRWVGKAIIGSGGSCRGRLAKKTATFYDVDPATLQADVASLVAELRGRDLVV